MSFAGLKPPQRTNNVRWGPRQARATYNLNVRSADL